MTSRQYRFWAVVFAAHLGTSAVAAVQAPETDVDTTDLAYPIVITPTRLRQSLADVPASVTVISADTIQRFGLTSIPDILRFVPGMAVLQATGHDYRINYHGADSLWSRRMNVLIDGVSAYSALLSRVEWPLLPVAIEDIDRIEVIRGPDSSSYGPNSMAAVINILTKHPGDVERVLISASADSRGRQDSTLRVATTMGTTRLAFTGSTLRDRGYDQVTVFHENRDSARVQRLNLQAETVLQDRSTLAVQASYVRGHLEDGGTAPFVITSPDRLANDGQVSARWTKSLSADHELQVLASSNRSTIRQRWTACWPKLAFVPELYALFRLNPDYVVQLLQGVVPTGGTPEDDELAGRAITAVHALGLTALAGACGQTDQDVTESRTQLEVQDAYVFSDRLRVVGGLGLRYQRAESQTLLAGAVGNTVHWLFGHAEYRPFGWLTTNVGGYAESNSLSGDNFSPRLAVNAHLSESQTVRAVYSEGTRTPDLLEERGNWSYTYTGLTPAPFGSTTGRLFGSAQFKGGLRSERIVSHELGYLLTLRPAGLSLDVKLFDDHLSQLITDYTQQALRVAVNVSNHDSVRLTGAEVQGRWDASARWSALLSYGYLLNRDGTDPSQRYQYSKHSGSLGVSHLLSDAWRVSLAYFGSSGNGLFERRYGRTDLTVGYAFKWPLMPGLASLAISYLDNTTATVPLGTTRSFEASYSNPLTLRGAVRVAF